MANRKMANKKNSVSDNEVKNAAGGYVEKFSEDRYGIYDNDTNKKVGETKDLNEAFREDSLYHAGKGIE